jgi:hypothetical protein
MRRWLLPLLILGCLAGLFLACYNRAIFGGEQFAYRDAAHYYYPLHQRVQAEWDAARWPLWEPEENSGMPLLGNPTAAVLYPGKLVFALVRYPLAARLYIMGHTVLALAAMLALLRHWGISWVGSTLGALAYAFGGPVLFQYCNIIYLVGAAWLPLGFRAVDRWLRLGRRIALAELTVVLAMETLGGDPESAYVTGVCAVAYAIGLAWVRGGTARRTRWRQPVRAILGVLLVLTLWVVATLAAARWATVSVLPRTPWIGSLVLAAWGLAALVLLVRWRRLRNAGARPILVPSLFGLVVAGLLAAASAAAQLLPVLEFISQSVRAARDGPHNIYLYSLQPFRLVEFVWPNVFGTVFDGNTLWLGALPPRDADVRVWVPTLYLGGLTLVLALSGLRMRSGPGSEVESAPWRAWIVAIAAISLLGSFGEFGSPIGWARMSPSTARWISPHAGTGPAPARSPQFVRDGDGSVYWLLATGLPGFAQFRFPSKLLTFTVLGLAVLAARQWDVLAAGDPRARRRTAAWSVVLLGLTLVPLVLSVTWRKEFLAWLKVQNLDSMFGPFDAPAALAATQGGLVHAALVLTVSLALALRLAGRRPATAAALALVVTTVDLARANAQVVTTVPQSVMDSTLDVVSVIERAENDRPVPGPYRVHRVPVWCPIGWGRTRSPNRVGDFVAWERQTAGPKYGINVGVHYTMTLGVSQLYDYEWFFGSFHYRARDQAAQVLGVEPGTELVAFSRRAFDLWNTRYFILPYYVRWNDETRGIASFIDHTVRIDPPPDAFQGADGQNQVLDWLENHDYQVRRNLDAYPRAWVVHDSRPLLAFHELSRAGRVLPMEEMLFSNDISWPDPTRSVSDPHRLVWLEEPDRRALVGHLSGGPPASGETVRVIPDRPDRVTLEAVLERAGIVVLADIYYPGWTLTIDGQAAPVYRANHMMRGAAVAAGRHTLVYTYRPASFRTGLVVSALGLAGLCALVLWSALAPHSPAGARPAALSS